MSFIPKNEELETRNDFHQYRDHFSDAGKL